MLGGSALHRTTTSTGRCMESVCLVCITQCRCLIYDSVRKSPAGLSAQWHMLLQQAECAGSLLLLAELEGAVAAGWFASSCKP